MLYIFSIILLLFTQIYASDYGGCDGMVTIAAELSKHSKTKVDFTVVKVKLLSKDGVMKDSTECAPTGHYFVPTYDKGSFILEIQGPSGWNFEPTRVPVTVSENSPCGNNNFKFTGFSLIGKVTGSGSSSKTGPQGVTLTLYADGVKAGTAVSDETGTYEFHNIYPGTYEISASHPRWQISPSKVKTSMDWNNLQVSTNFVVSGFSVSGTVLSGDEPVPDVKLYLYSETINSAGCTAPPSGAPSGKSKGKLLCAETSNAKGEFLFVSVPPGDYTIVPVYSSAHTNFDVAPTVAPIHVGNGDAVVEAPFRVVGFGVSGKVVAGGQGIEGARVLVNGAEKAVTGKDGVYRLEQFKAGTYDITAEKSNFVFAKLKGERISGTAPKIQDIQVTEVSVCGTLSIANPPPNMKLGTREVQIKGDGTTKYKQQTVQADKDGKYCASLPIGTYTITPVVSSAEEKAGLTFSPSSSTVEVSSTPLTDINFSQLRVTVSGRVVCLVKPCDRTVAITLDPASSGSSSSQLTASLDSNSQFKLEDVLPGNYRISVSLPNDAWCWDSQSRDISIKKDTTDIEFVQTGYVMSVNSPHDLELTVSVPRSSNEKMSPQTHKVRTGDNRVCLEKPGSYELTTKSCFRFGKDSFMFDTASPKPLNLQVSRADMQVQGSVRSPNAKSAVITVTDTQAGALLKTVTAEPSGKDTLAFEYWAELGAQLKFTASNPDDKTVLAHPASRELTIPNTATACLSPLQPFEFREGKFLKGKVVPNVEGVRISVKNNAGEEVAHAMTSSDGQYNVGPLYEGEHTVEAHKEDFHFRKDGSGLLFTAAKLGRVRVSAADAATGEFVPGVLLSLSGENYHNNSAIPAGGALVFSDLFPGEYFLRAHLKEYSFDPASARLTVREGEEAAHKFVVKRVAFSCFGSVKGLNGHPERGVVVLAQPKNSDTASLEEAQTDSAGNFRLRGLVPKVAYSIYVKNSISNAAKATSGDLAIPESVSVTPSSEDMRNVVSLE